MKHTCPHCGEKTYSPLQKALCGGMTSAGRACPSCGGHSVNGKLSLAVHTVTSLLALGMVLYTYFTHQTMTQILYFGLIPVLAVTLFNFLFDAFFGKLIKMVRRN